MIKLHWSCFRYLQSMCDSLSYIYNIYNISAICGLLTTYGVLELINICSGNGWVAYSEPGRYLNGYDDDNDCDGDAVTTTVMMIMLIMIMMRWSMKIIIIVLNVAWQGIINSSDASITNKCRTITIHEQSVFTYCITTIYFQISLTETNTYHLLRNV